MNLAKFKSYPNPENKSAYLELPVIKFVCHLQAVIINDSLFDNNYGITAINTHFLKFTLNTPYFSASLLVLSFYLLFRRYSPTILSTLLLFLFLLSSFRNPFEIFLPTNSSCHANDATIVQQFFTLIILYL